MKNKIIRLLIVLSVILLFYLVFILLGGIKSYFKTSTLITLCCATLYLVLIFLLVKQFNKAINNLSLTDFIGKNHFQAILIGIVAVAFSFFVPTIVEIQFDFTFQPINKIFQSSFEFIVVSISEELVFRAFLFLSILYIFRHLLLSAIITSLLFTLIHFYEIDNFIPFLWVFSTGMLMTYLYVYTKSIGAPITFHFLINLLNTNIIIQINDDHFILLGQAIVMILFVFVLGFLITKYEKVHFPIKFSKINNI